MGQLTQNHTASGMSGTRVKDSGNQAVNADTTCPEDAVDISVSICEPQNRELDPSLKHTHTLIHIHIDTHMHTYT
jgi:hypothetical protein